MSGPRQIRFLRSDGARRSAGLRSAACDPTFTSQSLSAGGGHEESVRRILSAFQNARGVCKLGGEGEKHYVHSETYEACEQTWYGLNTPHGVYHVEKTGDKKATKIHEDDSARASRLRAGLPYGIMPMVSLATAASEMAV